MVLSTHDGFYKQVDGLAVRSPRVPHLANGWLNQFENLIKNDAKIYMRYMDDILREIKCSRVEQKLEGINNIHKNLEFTLETEVDHNLSFLNMRLIHDHETGKLSSTWYFKLTDTGLIMNYHALAPKRYKHSVVSGFVYRIYRACSSWQNFHDSSRIFIVMLHLYGTREDTKLWEKIISAHAKKCSRMEVFVAEGRWVGQKRGLFSNLLGHECITG